MTTNGIAALAQPFSFGGGTTGVLLIHGFGGIPAELRLLGEFLAEHGYTVQSVLLARHGQLPEALHGVRWPEWYDGVEMVYHELRARCPHVVVIGFSLGGLLALHLAAHQPVDGVVALAPALQLRGGWPLRLLPVAQYIVRWYYPFQFANFSDPKVRAMIREKGGDLDWDDPQVIKKVRTSVRIPTGAINEIVRLSRQVRRELPQIQVPALVLQGKRDQVVVPLGAQQTFDGLGSPDKKLVWFEQSRHELAADVEHKQVFRTIGEWLDARVPARNTTETQKHGEIVGEQAG